MEIKIKTIKELVEVAINELAGVNERNRLLLNEGRIYGYLVATNLRLKGLNAEESSQTIFEEIIKNPAHYKYEQGRVHLFCN